MKSVELWQVELRHSWPLLVPSTLNEITTATLQVAAGVAEIRLGVDGVGTRHLLLAVGAGREPMVDEADGNLVLGIRTLSFAGRSAQYFDVSCRRADLFDLFDEVVVDILTALETDPSDPVEAAADVISRWRALLEMGRRRVLGPIEQMSLFGELYVLDLATDTAHLDPSWWRGPLREPHDIVLPSVALEVKAIGAASSILEIHGERQLEPPGSPLGLVVATLAEGQNGVTLPSLIARLLARTTDRGEFTRRLLAAGYASADGERYTSRFEVEDLAYLVVVPAIPRIVPASFASGVVPGGVSSINYRITLDTLNPFLVRGAGALQSWVRELTR